MKFFHEQISLRDSFWWVLILVPAALCLYLPSSTACALSIPPDSSEYSIGLVNLLEHGRFGFTLNGVWYPSRYTPWFSLSCLTPAYLLSGGNPLCFHWAILGFALVTLVLMVKWCQRMGMGRWSFLPALILLFVPDFAFYSRIVMTEIPYVALFAISALVWLYFVVKGQSISLRFCLGVGALIAWGGMVRPTMLPMIVLFALVVWLHFPWKDRLMRWGVLVAPILFYEGVNILYNKCTFGSYSRSGYHYWVPIPCDFPNLLFNWENVCHNAHELLGLPVVQLTFGMLLVSLVFTFFVLRGYAGGPKQNRIFLLLFGYVLAHFVVLLALYVGYYWDDSRFYLAVTICLIPLSLYAVLRMVAWLPFHSSQFVFMSVVLLMGWAFLSARPKYRDLPYWRQVWLTKGHIAGQVLPEQAIVLQYGDPNVLDYFCWRERGLTLFPYQRVCNYVTYMTASNSIRSVYRPVSLYSSYIPELIEHGICQSPFPVTFEENPSQVKQYLAAGRRVFIEQFILDEKQNSEFVQQKLKSLGLEMKYFGVWQAPALKPNSFRHFYDKLVLGDCKMDSRPDVFAGFWEIVPLEEISR